MKWVRESAITRVWTLIRDVQKLYPGAKISFLAHSFGTFIVAQIFQKEFDFKAHRIVFCGSVVRYDFPFHEISEQFTSPLVNEVRSADFWPAIAESVTWGYGSAGTYGFRVPRVRDRWHNNFGHSNFLTPEFCARFWVPFFADGTIVDADKTPRASPFYVRLLSRIKLKYIILLTLLAFVWLMFFGRQSYERATFDLNGIQYVGYVRWESRFAPPEFGEPPVIQVLAIAEIPSADIKLQLLIFRYHVRAPRADSLYRMLKCQQGIPQYCVPSMPELNASHLIVMKFTLGGSHGSGKIASTPEFRLRPSVSTTDKIPLYLNSDSRLSSLRAGQPENLFIIGLSGNPNDEKNNLLDLRRYPLFELQIEFADGSRGFMLLAKGASGNSVVNAAVEEWLQITGGL